MGSLKFNDTGKMYFKFYINSCNIQTRKKFVKFQSMHGTPLQRKYGNIHIIANFSAINDSIQKQNDGFNDSHIHVRVLFGKYQKKKFNIRAMLIIYSYLVCLVIHYILSYLLLP